LFTGIAFHLWNVDSVGRHFRGRNDELHSVSFIVDDVPEDSQIKKDLKFLETNFSASCPGDRGGHRKEKGRSQLEKPGKN